jgi:hypothetical protein
MVSASMRSDIRAFGEARRIAATTAKLKRNKAAPYSCAQST